MARGTAHIDREAHGAACLCDADKSLLHQSATNLDPSSTGSPVLKYEGIRLVNKSVRPIIDGGKYYGTTTTMAGIARTVQCTRRNDILAVLGGLMDAEPDDVLVVNTSDSTLAVAGELFATEAVRRGLRAIVIDGPVRDTKQVRQLVSEDKLWVYATSVVPYAGTAQSPGNSQVPVVSSACRSAASIRACDQRASSNRISSGRRNPPSTGKALISRFGSACLTTGLPASGSPIYPTFTQSRSRPDDDSVGGWNRAPASPWVLGILMLILARRWGRLRFCGEASNGIPTCGI
jgi:hypothetical protein